jgi:AbrB family looped-hinge helix DNA binding protein
MGRRVKPGDGRIVIPKVVRRSLGLKTGDRIRFKVGDKGAVTITGWRGTGLLSVWIANPPRQAPHPGSTTRRL